MSLGSIYEEQAGAKGRDLRWEIEVSPKAAGHPGGAKVEIPDRLPVKNAPERAARTVSPQDPPGSIILHLPASFTSGSALRLRGYGEANAQGRAGDLYLVVKLSPQAVTALVVSNQGLARRETTAPAPAPWILVVAGALAALLGALFVI